MQDKFDRFVERHPHPHGVFFDRPHWTRRRFFQITGAGLTGAYLAQRAGAADSSGQPGVTPKGTAKNVIFVLLAGAPSHVDTFDLKVADGITPAGVTPETVNGILWPTGILPKLGGQLSDIAIVRSMRSWALAHSLGQRWTQIGRNPSAALGDIAPNIGSIVAIEKDLERRPNQIFPTFIALNSAGMAGGGYLPSTYAPFQTTPSVNGIANLRNPDGAPRMERRWNLLHTLDDPLRNNALLGQPVSDFDKFDAAARSLMTSPAVDSAFGYTAADSARFGSTGFGNACLVATQVLAADQGARFIQITLGGWDMHVDIYGKNNPKGNNIFTLGKSLDDGLSAMLADLKSSGLLAETLVVMVGEFGRTVGKLSPQLGRDHFLQQFAVFAGGGVKGGQVIGSTNADGSDTVDFGWSRQRYVKPEDVEATIYSAVGIDWTTVRRDDPFGRGFEYVPFSDQDLYGPIGELWV